MPLPPNFLDELRARLPISAVVGRRVRLIRAGRETKACCPFHKEKTPSFTVSDDKGFFHCLAAETGVILEQGVRPIGSLAGTTQKVLTRGGSWVDAAFKSYGVQRLHRISLSRNGLSKVVYATSGHRWFVRGARHSIITAKLRVGHRLEAVLPRPRQDWTLDRDGVAHGIVFGDGSVQNGYGHVHLHGEKDRILVNWFPNQRPVTRFTEQGQPYLRIYGGKSFSHMKSLPSLDEGDEYLLGFLAGYLSADGHVAKDGTVMLNSAKREHLEWVRTAATRVGIGTFGITTAMRRGLASADCEISRIHFVSSTLNASMFLGRNARDRFEAASKAFDRLRWTVTGVEETDREEDVYCAEVPGEHAFALEDNILTGNCFGCGAHGDIIGFVMRHDHLSFMEAVEHLAGQAGMTVPQATPEERARAERQKGLHELVETACRFFEQQLQAPGGRRAQDYLAGRGLDQDTIARFRLGYAPAEGGALIRALKAEGFGDDALVEAGVARRPEEGGTPYAFFRNRVVFPVTDRRGRVVAFGARLLDGDGPKYLNSPDTPLFEKGKLLYGLARARIAAGNGQPVILAEGYMDVIALVRAGFEAAVAPLGTALTETQIKELWSLKPSSSSSIFEPIICFDGDLAGQKAAERSILRILPHLEPGFSFKFIFLPEDEDPDSLIRTQGSRIFSSLIDNSTSLADAVWVINTRARPFKTPDDFAALKKNLLEIANAISNNIVRKIYVQDFSNRCFQFWRAKSKNESRSLLSQSLRELQLSGASEFRPKAESILIGLILTYPKLALEFDETLNMNDYCNREVELLWSDIFQNVSNDPDISPSNLQANLYDQGQYEAVSRVLKYVNIFLSRQNNDDHEIKARDTFRHILDRYYEKSLESQIYEAGMKFRHEFTADNFRRLQILQQKRQDIRSTEFRS